MAGDASPHNCVWSNPGQQPRLPAWPSNPERSRSTSATSGNRQGSLRKRSPTGPTYTRTRSDSSSVAYATRSSPRSSRSLDAASEDTVTLADLTAGLQ